MLSSLLHRVQPKIMPRRGRGPEIQFDMMAAPPALKANTGSSQASSEKISGTRRKYRYWAA